MGWVRSARDMGGVIFIDLRDREGVLQVVIDSGALSGDEFRAAEFIKGESIVAVEGVMALRDIETRNEKLPTGTVELRATRFEVLSRAGALPFQPDTGAAAREELRLKHRYLDLRRPEMLYNIKFRARAARAARAYLEENGFIEAETPVLSRSTPEGARDYLVPSRLHKGAFYALVQSPQLFKQLLMMGGLDRYYQFARCFRDEDLRSDRQPEFTQIDVEMSFADEEDVIGVMEGLVARVFAEALGMRIELPLVRMTWREAMDKYGSDKPD
jgi:aspartyl-tRNA synthetase